MHFDIGVCGDGKKKADCGSLLASITSQLR